MRARELLFGCVLCVAGAAIAQPTSTSTSTSASTTASATGAQVRPIRIDARERQVPTKMTRAHDRQLAIADKTENLLDANIASRELQLRSRLRAAYRGLRRNAPAPPSVGGERAPARARARLGIRQVLDRDVGELKLVRAELTHIKRARLQLQEARTRAADMVELSPRSLRNPVAFSRVLKPFGLYRHEPSKARLSHRGVLLSSQIGRNVRAVAAGRVRYIGEIRGLGLAALVDHGDFSTLSGPLKAVATSPDAELARADIIGESHSDTVYFEVRMTVGGAGVPVDPVPLIAW